MIRGVIFLLSLLIAAPAFGVEFRADGLAVPFFNERGQLSHKLTAERGRMVASRHHLESVVIEYYSGTQPDLVVQRVQAERAVWDDGRQTLSGDGRVEVETEESRLAGTGFDFALDSAVLNIHRDFRLSTAEAVVTSERATVDLVLEREGETLRFRDIRRCIAERNVHIVIAAAERKRHGIDEAVSERVVYDGRARTITSPGTVRALRAGRESTSATVNVQLGPARGRRLGF